MNEHWHLDKRVPISLIATIIVQTAAFVWLIAQMDSRIAENERRIAEHERGAGAQMALVNQNVTSVAVINETLRNVEQSLGRIEAALKDERE